MHPELPETRAESSEKARVTGASGRMDTSACRVELSSGTAGRATSTTLQPVPTRRDGAPVPPSSVCIFRSSPAVALALSSSPRRVHSYLLNLRRYSLCSRNALVVFVQHFRRSLPQTAARVAFVDDYRRGRKFHDGRVGGAGAPKRIDCFFQLPLNQSSFAVDILSARLHSLPMRPYRCIGIGNWV